MRASANRVVGTSLLAVLVALSLGVSRPQHQARPAAPPPIPSAASTPTPTSTSTPTTATTTATSTTSTSPPPSPVHVVGLGDSVTAGTACGCTPFVATYAAMLAHATGRPADSVNLGRPGLTTTGLASQLASASTRAQLARATVVVVTIGANDLGPLVSRWSGPGCDATCIGDAAAQLGPRLASTLKLLRDVVPSGADVLVTTYWNVFEDGDVADRDYGQGFAAWSDAVTRAANTRIEAAARSVGAQLVDLYEPFEGSGDRNATALLADDGDHPNAAGHRLIAQVLLRADGLSHLH